MTDYNEELRQLEESKKTIGFQKVLPSKVRARMVSGINKDISSVKRTRIGDLAGSRKYEARELAEERRSQASQLAAKRQEEARQKAEGRAYDAAMAQEKRQELAAERAQNRSVAQEARVEAKAQAVWERQRGKEVKAIGGTATGALKGGAKIGLTVIKGLGKIAFRKGVRHPDSLIDPKARFLYLPTNPKMTPLGHFMDNPMELYFGSKRTRGVPPSARVVLSALQQGASIEQLEVVTSLSPQEINQSLRYLVDKKLIDKEVLE